MIVLWSVKLHRVIAAFVIFVIIIIFLFRCGGIVCDLVAIIIVVIGIPTLHF